MQKPIHLLIVAFSAVGLLTIPGLDAESGDYGRRHSQDETAPPPPASQVPSFDASPSDIVNPPVTQGMPSVMQPGPAIVGPIAPHAGPCSQCGCATCCCPPTPAWTTLCLTDPCGCCTYDVRVCVPGRCVGCQPVVKWRNGLFGRKIATLCWDCGHRVKVVVTRRGKVRVWG